MNIGFLATCPPAISVSESHGGLLRVLRPGWWGGVTFASRRGRKVAHYGPNVRVYQEPGTEEQKLGPTRVVWSPKDPRVPMAWFHAQTRPLSSMKCQKHCVTRHETVTPLARRPRATKISRPNRFARLFRSRPRWSRRPLRLELPAGETPSYRDTANLGLGETPRN